MEYYCYSKRGCFYHGPETKCPNCGRLTKPVREDIYKPRKPDHDGYQLREIKGPVMGMRAVKGKPKPRDMFNEGDSDTADVISEYDPWWEIPIPHHIVWKKGKKLSIYQGVKI